MKNLNKRKMLAAKVLGVGLARVIFDNSRLEEIKEAITKQDIRDLYEAGAITLREIRGKRTYVPRTTKRGPGKIKKIVHDRKGDYVKLTRKLRRYVKELHSQDKFDLIKYKQLRKMIKARAFKDKNHIRNHIEGNAK